MKAVLLTGSGGTILRYRHPRKKERKWIPQPRRLLFPFLAPPAARLHALVAARRLKAVASAHAACSATAAGAVAAGSAATDSVIPLPSAASPPAAHHCQLSIVAQRQRIIAAALHSCFATMQPALCRLRRPSLTACSRFDSSASWVSQILSVPESQQCQWPRYRRCYASNCQLPESLLRAIASSSTTSATKYLQQPTLTACTRFDPSAS